MLLIEAINVGMRAIGHTNIVDEQSPNPNAGHIRSIIEIKRKKLLTKGWWFNTLWEDARVPSTGIVKVPYNALAVYSEGFYNEQRYGIKDGVLYNIFKRSNLFEPDVLLKLKYILDIEFEYLPEYAADYIANSAAAEAYMNDLGMDNNSARFEAQANESLQLLTVQEVRNLKQGVRKSNDWKRMERFLRI